MSLYNTPNMTGGMDETLVEVFNQVPSLGIGILVFVFFFVLITGVTSQKRKEGYMDVPYWALMAAMSTFLLSLAMSLKSGMISGLTLGIVIASTLLIAVWFFLSKARGEV